MAISKGESLKSMSVGEYINSIGATQLAIKPKSVHFKKGEEYLGYVNRSSKNQGQDLKMTDPVLIDGKYGKDWIGVPPNMEWTNVGK